MTGRLRFGRTAHGRKAMALTSLAALAACAMTGETPNTAAPVAVAAPDLTAPQTGTRPDWPTHGGTFAEQRHAGETQITPGNVAGLKLAWFHDLDTDRGQEATPLMVDGVVYTSTAWSKAVAVDAATGRELWSYDPEVPGEVAIMACCDVVNRGPAMADGRVFISTLDGRLIALDAKTGSPIWSTMTVVPGKAYTITGAPRAAGGLVYIGNGGAELGVRGYVSAYDQQTGKLVWRFYTVPGDPRVKDNAASDEIIERLARPTWSGDKYYDYGGGGTVWDSIVYDEELDRIYIGTGNGSPWTHTIRSEGKGDNLFLSSIVALDARTGKYLWHYQEVPGENWDFTATQQIVLDTLEWQGQRRQVIMHAPKNGFFYVIDRVTGKLLSAEKFADANWAERIDMATGRPVENPGARYENGPFLATIGGSGAHNFHAMSWDPVRRVMYIPAQQVPFLYVKDRKFQYTPGHWNLGVDMLSTPLPETPADIAAMKEALQGSLLAWDPIAQKKVWQVPHGMPWNGGALSTASGLVFQGLANGSFRAYASDSGRKLWQFDAQTAIVGAPISYSLNGKQFVVVMAGNGGGFPLTLPDFDGPKPRLQGRILAFTLEGAASLPPKPTDIAPLNPSTETFPAAQVELGKAKFAANCASCHGMGTLSAGIVPDLKRSAAVKNADLWHAIVIDGILSPRGMISFKDRISPADAQAIRAYVSTEAARRIAAGGK